MFEAQGFEERHAPEFDEEVYGITRRCRDAKRSHQPLFEFGSPAKPQRSQRNPGIPGGHLRHQLFSFMTRERPAQVGYFELKTLGVFGLDQHSLRKAGGVAVLCAPGSRLV